MTDSFKKLMREQVQNNLNAYSVVATRAIPKGGWIRTIRDALGMSTRALSKILKCSQSNITSLENREKKGSITLKSLEDVAQAMGCRLVYSIVPIKSIDDTLMDRAKVIINKQLDLTNHSMKLEQQGLTTKQLEKLKNKLTKELLEDPKRLWDNE